MKDLAAKREREKALVSEMIALYCKKRHGTKGGLCPECAALAAYARKKERKMPFYGDQDLLLQLPGALLPTGNEGKIRAVMRFSGPRMMLCHPVPALRHVVEEQKEKRRLAKELAGGTK